VKERPGAAVSVGVLGALATPVPLTARESGLLPAFDVTITLSVFAPIVVGVNVTEIEQLLPAVIPAPQVFVCEN
jgi:hypothetical protein